MFNGHLTASNSDVRAGSNYDRHTSNGADSRTGGGIFSASASLPLTRPKADKDTSSDGVPRAGKKPVETMTEDFLKHGCSREISRKR
jgi:hypothetical protein